MVNLWRLNTEEQRLAHSPRLNIWRVYKMAATRMMMPTAYLRSWLVYPDVYNAKINKTVEPNAGSNPQRKPHEKSVECQRWTVGNIRETKKKTTRKIRRKPTLNRWKKFEQPKIKRANRSKMMMWTRNYANSSLLRVLTWNSLRNHRLDAPNRRSKRGMGNQTQKIAENNDDDFKRPNLRYRLSDTLWASIRRTKDQQNQNFKVTEIQQKKRNLNKERGGKQACNAKPGDPNEKNGKCNANQQRKPSGKRIDDDSQRLNLHYRLSYTQTLPHTRNSALRPTAAANPRPITTKQQQQR